MRRGRGLGKKKTTQKRTSRACVVLSRPPVWSRVAGFVAPPGVRLRGRRVFSTRPPPFQSPLPLPLSPAGALSPAPGPCSPAPAPVGFVSTGRRHPGCVPLDGTLGYLLEEAGGGRDSGVAGGFVCGGGDRSSVPVARNLAVPAPWGPAATAPVSAPAPPARHPL